MMPMFQLAGTRVIVARQPHCPRRKPPRRRQAFTLIELLVVIAIMALLVSILLPSLRTARQLAQAALCQGNLHGLYNAAALYATECNGYLGPTYELTQIYGMPPYNRPVPAVYYEFGPPYVGDEGREHQWGGRSTPLDAYWATGCVEGALISDQARYWSGDRKARLAEVQIAVCPLARASFTLMSSVYSSTYGRVRGSYFFSSLMREYGWPTPENDNKGEARNNCYGPWRPEELFDTGRTVWAGDATAYIDAGDFGYGVGPDDTKLGKPQGVDVMFSRQFTMLEVANPYRLFGAITTYSGVHSEYDPLDYYHVDPAAAHWDGHVSAYSPPRDSDLYAMVKHTSRDGTNAYP